MTFSVRFLEISGNFHHRKSLFTTSFHYIFTTFSLHLHHNLHHIKFSRHLFTTNFHYGGTNRQGRTNSMGTHRQIFTTYLHHKFTLHIFTTDFHHKFSLQIFMTIVEKLDFHDIFTTPVVKIQIFTTFSPHFPDMV